MICVIFFIFILTSTSVMTSIREADWSKVCAQIRSSQLPILGLFPFGVSRFFLLTGDLWIFDLNYSNFEAKYLRLMDKPIEVQDKWPELRSENWFISNRDQLKSATFLMGKDYTSWIVFSTRNSSTSCLAFNLNYPRKPSLHFQCIPKELETHHSSQIHLSDLIAKETYQTVDGSNLLEINVPLANQSLASVAYNHTLCYVNQTDTSQIVLQDETGCEYPVNFSQPLQAGFKNQSECVYIFGAREVYIFMADSRGQQQPLVRVNFSQFFRCGLGSIGGSDKVKSFALELSLLIIAVSVCLGCIGCFRNPAIRRQFRGSSSSSSPSSSKKKKKMLMEASKKPSNKQPSPIHKSSSSKSTSTSRTHNNPGTATKRKPHHHHYSSKSTNNKPRPPKSCSSKKTSSKNPKRQKTTSTTTKNSNSNSNNNNTTKTKHSSHSSSKRPKTLHSISSTRKTSNQRTKRTSANSNNNNTNNKQSGSHKQSDKSRKPTTISGTTTRSTGQQQIPQSLKYLNKVNNNPVLR